jgi:putative hydrolase of the HAD superfamily
MSSLKAVLFDVDDTLFSTTEFARRARRNAVRAMISAGLQADEELVVTELGEVVAEFGSNYDHHYDKLLMRLPAGATDGINRALLVTAGMVAYHDTKFQELKPFPDVIPLLESLRAAGVKTGIITHGWTTKQAEKLIRLGLVPYLDKGAVFISDQLGISKPNPKLYSTALRTLGLEPQEVMYVGDNLAHDIAPPNELGMPTVWAARAARSGQHAGIQPRHKLMDFTELGNILREEYGVTP